MPAQWSPFIDEVSDILENRVPSDAKDFGNKLANAYLTAVKNNATCIPGMAPHESSAGESVFIASYEQWFHDLWEKGEPVMVTPDNEEPLVNEKDNLIAFLATAEGAATRLTIAGKDNDPEYNKLEGEISGGIQYEPTEELDKYLEEFKDDEAENLYRYRYFEFHRLDGKESADELARITATRLLMTFEDISDGEKRLDFWKWLERLEKNTHFTTSVGIINDRTRNRDNAITTLKGLDWSWSSFAGYSSGNKHRFHELVVQYIRESILLSHPASTEYTNSYGNIAHRTVEKANEVAVEMDKVNEMTYPWPFDTAIPEGYEEMEPSEKIKVRYHFKLNNLKMQEPYEENQKMPPVLTQSFVSEFSWNGTDDYGQKHSKLKSEYVDTELRKKWQGCPLGTSDEGQDSIVNIDMSKTGTLAKQIRNVLIAEIGIEALMLAEGGSKDDPYNELAKATLKYWKDATIQPFATDPPTPPCLSVPVLQGKYIGVSYGNQKKLADNLRRALNSGKASGDAHEAAETVASALAYSYFTHLSQMKFIYMGGIPVPLVPYIPMIGFDATVI
tara:strand:+ start:111 stop:1790 length:1680 start_codon:yes stop_codon:yes gene_type:complete